MKKILLVTIVVLLFLIPIFSNFVHATYIKIQQEDDNLHIIEKTKVSLDNSITYAVINEYSSNISIYTNLISEYISNESNYIENTVNKLSRLLKEKDQLKLNQSINKLMIILNNLTKYINKTENCTYNVVNKMNNYPWVKNIIGNDMANYTISLLEFKKELNEILNTLPRNKNELTTLVNKLIDYLNAKKTETGMYLSDLKKDLSKIDKGLKYIKRAKNLRDLYNMRKKFKGLWNNIIDSFKLKFKDLWQNIMKGPLLMYYLSIPTFKTMFNDKMKKAIEDSLIKLYNKIVIIKNFTINISFKMNYTNIGNDRILNVDIFIEKTFDLTNVITENATHIVIDAKVRYLNITEDIDLENFIPGWVINPSKDLFTDYSAFKIPLQYWNKTYLPGENKTIFTLERNLSISLPIGNITIDPQEIIAVKGLAEGKDDQILIPKTVSVPVKIRVLDLESKKPVKDANVTLWQDGKVIASGLTDSNGTITLVVKTGIYKLTIDKESYIHYEKKIEVKPPETILETLTLEPMPKPLINTYYMIIIGIIILIIIISAAILRKRIR